MPVKMLSCLLVPVFWLGAGMSAAGDEFLPVKTGAELLWKADIEPGRSSVCVANGKAYVAGGYDAGVLSAFSIEGEPLWTAAYDEQRGEMPAGPQAASAACEDAVFVLSERANLYCFDALTGTKRWTAALKQRGQGPAGAGGGEVLRVVGDLVVAARRRNGGGYEVLAAFDRRTGAAVTQANPDLAAKAAEDQGAVPPARLDAALAALKPSLPVGKDQICATLVEGMLFIRGERELFVYDFRSVPAPGGWRNAGDGNFASADPPIRWWKKKHVLWSVKAGKGRSSPVACMGRVFLTVEPGGLACIDGTNGKVLWLKPDVCEEALRGQTPAKADPETGYACPTPVVAGRSVFAVFGNGVAVRYDVDGNRKWAVFVESPNGAHGASPVFSGGVLIVVFERLSGLDAETGKPLWQVPVPADQRYGSPVAATLGQTPVVLTGCGRIVRTRDGQVLTESLPRTLYSSPVVDRVAGVICVSGVQTDGKNSIIAAYELPAEAEKGMSLKPLWKHEEPAGAAAFHSPLVCRGLMYVLSTDGILRVLDARKGGEVYRTTLTEGSPPARPASYARYPALVRAGRRIYISGLSGERGTSRTVVADRGREFEKLWEYGVEDTVCGVGFEQDRQYVRVGEWLYGIGGITPVKPEMDAPLIAVDAAKAVTPDEKTPAGEFRSDVLPAAWIWVGPFMPRTLAVDFLKGIGGREAARPVPGTAVSWEGTNMTFQELQVKCRWTDPKFTDSFESITVAASANDAGQSLLGANWNSTAYLYTVVSNDSRRFLRFHLLTPNGAGWNFPSRFDGTAWLAGGQIDEKSYIRLEQGCFPLMLQVSIGELDGRGRIWMAPRLEDVSREYERKIREYEKAMAEQWPPEYEASLKEPLILSANGRY